MLLFRACASSKTFEPLNIPTHARGLTPGAQCHVREDLVRPSGGSQFFVSEPLPASEIVSRLEGRPSMLRPSPSLATVFIFFVEEFETDATKPDSLDIVTNKELLLG